MVLAGIIIARLRTISADDPQHPTNIVWRVLDQILNGILFLLLGVELLAIEKWNIHVMLATVACFPIIIIARYLSLFIPWTISNRGIPNRELILLSWCGIRGGVSIALALQIPASLADGQLRDAFVLGAFVTVVLSMLIQGITAPKLVEKLSGDLEQEPDKKK
jgi:CPA1 family monovalent cation:H+ antiporter